MAMLAIDLNKNNKNQELRDFLNDLIEYKGIKQQDIADAIGKSHTALWKFRKDGEGSEDLVKLLEIYREDYIKQISSAPQTKYSANSFLKTVDANNILGLCVATEAANGIGAVLGNAGTGKTYALKEFAKNNPKAVYLRADCLMSKRELLKEIARAVGAPVEGTSVRDYLMNIIEHLTYSPKVIIVDEIEQLMPSKNVSKIDVLRTIHDETKDYGNSLIIAGPIWVEHKLKKRTVGENYGQIDSRIDYLYRTQGLLREEIHSILDLNDWNFTARAKDYIANLVSKTTKGGIRWLTKVLERSIDVTGTGTVDIEQVKIATGMMML